MTSIIIISHVKKICSSSCDNVFSYYQLNSVASQHFFLTLILIVFLFTFIIIMVKQKKI